MYCNGEFLSQIMTQFRQFLLGVSEYGQHGDQSYRNSKIVIYDSRVVMTLKFPVSTSLECY